MEIKALFFDAYGTLFDVSSVASACREYFGAAGDSLSLLWRAKQLEYTWLRSLMGSYVDFRQVTGEALRFACRKLGLSLDEAAGERLIQAYDRLPAYPEVKAALAGLKGRTLAILSNGSPSMLAEVVASAGLDGVFDQVISVDEVKIYKPSPRVYSLALEKTGLRKSEVGFVSSNPFDVAGAGSFGFRTIWVDRGRLPWDELGREPDFIVKDLSGIRDCLA